MVSRFEATEAIRPCFFAVGIGSQIMSHYFTRTKKNLLQLSEDARNCPTDAARCHFRRKTPPRPHRPCLASQELVTQKMHQLPRQSKKGPRHPEEWLHLLVTTRCRPRDTPTGAQALTTCRVLRPRAVYPLAFQVLIRVLLGKAVGAETAIVAGLMVLVVLETAMASRLRAFGRLRQREVLVRSASVLW